MKESGRKINSYSYSNKHSAHNSDKGDDLSFQQVLSRRQKCKSICARYKAQVRVWLHHKDGGVAWDMWIMFLCFMSVVIYILQTYAESGKEGQIISLTTFQYRGTLYAEFIFSCFFTVDLIINLIASKAPMHYAFMGWGLVDIVTVSPVFYSAYSTNFTKEIGPMSSSKGTQRMRQYATYSAQFVALLRFARVLKITRFLRGMRLQRLFRSNLSQGTSQVLSASISLIAMWILAAGFVYFIECEVPAIRHAANFDPTNNVSFAFEKPMTFGDAVYFTMITMSTVGYGDFSPKTAAGMWVIIIVIVVGLTALGEKLSVISDVCSRMSIYKRKYKPITEQGEGHIIIMGDGTTDHVLLRDLLSEHFHPDNTIQRSAIEDVIIFGSSDPTPEIKINILQSFLGEKIQYYTGSIFNSNDLEAVRLKDARAIFIIGNCNTKELYDADSRNIVNALIIREYDHNAKLYCTVTLRESATKIASVCQPQLLICQDELKSNMISGTMSCPGLQLFFDNLSSGFSFEEKEGRPKWLKEYYDGASKELYTVPTPAFYGGKCFLDVALSIFEISKNSKITLVLLAIEVNGSYVSNPFKDWHLPPADDIRVLSSKGLCNLYIIASTLDDAIIILDESQLTKNKPRELNAANKTISVFSPSSFTDFPRFFAYHRQNHGAKEPTSFRSQHLFTAIDTGEEKQLNSLQGHIVICGRLRNALPVINNYRARSSLMATYAGMKGADLNIPAVIIYDGPVSDTVKTRGGFASNQFKSIYHLQGTPSSLDTLVGVNIREASVILVACGDASRDDEDTFVLLTYISILMCLQDVPAEDRPVVLVETASSMTMHVLTNRLRNDDFRTIDQSKLSPLSPADTRRGAQAIHRRFKKNTVSRNAQDTDKSRSSCFRCNKKGDSVQVSYEHDYMAIPSYTSGHCITSRSTNNFLAHARFAPGIIEIFNCFSLAIDGPGIDEQGKMNYSQVGAIMKLKIEPFYFGLQYAALFKALIENHGCLPIALYRQVDKDNNDNILPYVYSAPAWDTIIHQGDCCMAIFPPTSSAETSFQKNPNTDTDEKKSQPSRSILRPREEIFQSQRTTTDEEKGKESQTNDERISLNIANSRLSQNPLAGVELSTIPIKKKHDLIKEMGHEEFMKTMMEEYDLKVESLESDVEGRPPAFK